jgi:hypothetical protein
MMVVMVMMVMMIVVVVVTMVMISGRRRGNYPNDKKEKGDEGDTYFLHVTSKRSIIPCKKLYYDIMEDPLLQPSLVKREFLL